MLGRAGMASYYCDTNMPQADAHRLATSNGWSHVSTVALANGWVRVSFGTEADAAAFRSMVLANDGGYSCNHPAK